MDRVGIGWRPELAAGIFSNLECIDIVEVIADDFFRAPSRQLRAIQTLAAQVPVVLHGVSLGLASSLKVDGARLDLMARVVQATEPEFWSEHLAFVRAEDLELGHLAAPPRTPSTILGAAENIARAAKVVGSLPLLENVATLIDPPASVLDEAAWITRILASTGAHLLLDLNNLYVNAVNFGTDPEQTLRQLPLDRVRAVHIAGGKWLAAHGSERLLDDHLHRVPEAVFRLLTELAARGPQPLTVILERDGSYPPFHELLAELQRAREALAEGRAGARAPSPALEAQTEQPLCLDSARALEGFLTRLYVEERTRALFHESPEQATAGLGLAPDSLRALARLDRVGLELAAQSFAHKRQLPRR
jgi:uncharacterized protein (UPF0276 family)